MATYWVDPVGGSDAQDGTTFALAKQTIPGITSAPAITFSKNDVLNLVNTGNHTWPTSETAISGVAGTNFTSDIGLTIQGTDSAGVAAMATVAATGGDAVRRVFNLQSTANYVLVQNIIFDATANAADASLYTVCQARVSNAAGPIRFKEGSILGAATGVTCAGQRSLISMPSTSPNDSVQVEQWYFQNCKWPMGTAGWGGATMKATIKDSVGIWDNDDRGLAWMNPGSWPGAAPTNRFTFTGNTFYEDAGTTSNAAVANWNITSAVDIGTVDVYNNLVWIETTGTVEAFMSATSGVPSVTSAGTIDYNVIVGGPSVAAGSLTAAEWYEEPWDANNDDTTAPDEQTNDTVSYGEADTAVFNDPSSTYTWVLASGLSTTILKDLRPIKYQAAGQGGSTPGALPEFVNLIDPGGEDGDSGGGDPDNPATIPYLDVVPFYATVMEYNLNASIITVNDRVRQYYLRRDRENKGFREWTGRRLVTGTSATERLYSGIQTAELVFFESDNPVSLNASTTAGVFLPEATTVLVAGGDYTVIQVKNNSSTNTATSLLVAVD